MKNTYLIILLFTFLSCSNDDGGTEDNSTENFKIESYIEGYTYYGVDITNTAETESVVKFEYDNQDRIKKRIGGIISTAPNPFPSAYFTNLIYRDLEYIDNKISIVSNIISNTVNYQENEDVIVLNSQNKMIKKTTFDEFNHPQRDTIIYTYIENKLAEYIKTSYELDNSNSDFNRRNIEESTLFYTDKNLDSIVTVFSYKFDNSNLVIAKKETEIFSNYDNSFNPFKELFYFKESFTRSLSKNNYTSYSKWSSTYFYPNPNSQEGYYLPRDQFNYTIKNWMFEYDENGEWIYDEF